MATLTEITKIGDVKYYLCDTYANLASQNPKWTGSLCRVDDGTWYEWRQFDSALGSGSWQVYTGAPVSLTIGTGAITSTNPLPIKDGFYSSTPITAFSAISATPATPYELVVEGVYKEVKMKITGTSTSRTVTFKAKASASDTAAPWMGVNFSDGSATIATQTTTKDEWWLFSSFDGLYSLQFNVTAVAGGNLTMLLECVY